MAQAMMAETPRRSWGAIGFGLGVAFLALLLVSAGGDLKQANGGCPDPGQRSHEAWTQMALSLTETLPLENRGEWRRLVPDNPCLFLRINTLEMGPADAAMIPAPGDEFVRP
jgi:hypothetical protein